MTRYSLQIHHDKRVIIIVTAAGDIEEHTGFGTLQNEEGSSSHVIAIRMTVGLS